MKLKTKEDIYEIFYKDKYLFDFNNYSKNSKFHVSSNMNEIGKMEDEAEGKINIEFVGLKSLLDVDCKESRSQW